MKARYDIMKAGVHQGTREIEVESARDLELKIKSMNDKAEGGRNYKGYLPGSHWRA